MDEIGNKEEISDNPAPAIILETAVVIEVSANDNVNQVNDDQKEEEKEINDNGKLLNENNNVKDHASVSSQNADGKTTEIYEENQQKHEVIAITDDDEKTKINFLHENGE